MKKSNQTGGKNHKKYKKSTIQTEKSLLLKTQYQVYAIVKANQGGSRISVLCSDDQLRSAIIPGKFYKKVWFNQYDVILCDLNVGGNDKQCYIAHKYTAKEAAKLKHLGYVNFENISDFVEETTNIKNNIDDMFPHSSESEEKIINESLSESESSKSSESIDITKL